MKRHPVDHRFAECFVETSVSPEQLQHIRQCAQCRDELQQFENMIDALKDTVRSNVNHHLAQEVRPVHLVRLAPTPPFFWKWVLAAAVILSVGALPLIFHSRRSEVVSAPGLDSEASALMESININLSRDLPAPMEPLMLRIPQNDSQQ